MYLFGFFESEESASTWVVNETWTISSNWLDPVVESWSWIEWEGGDVQNIEVVEQIQNMDWAELAISWVWDYWVLFTVAISAAAAFFVKKFELV